MLTNISKCLAVFTAVASLFFLGFTAIAHYSGRNWEGDIDDLREFTFTKTDAPKPTWSATRRADGEKVTNPRVDNLPGAVVAARTKLKEIQKERIDQLNRDLTFASTRLTEVKQFIVVDLKGIDKRIAQMEKDLADLNVQILAQTDAGTQVAEQISTVQTDTEKRREEVLRLEAQLKEIRADKYRAMVQRQKLNDLLVRVSGSIERLRRRNQQLRVQLNKPPYEEAPAKSGTN